MIFDLPLILTATFFFFISWAYAWGLLRFFRHRFAWDLASVTGIASVVCCAFTFVWMPRVWLGYNEPLNMVYSRVLVDLAVIFYAALPAMSVVRWVLRKDEQAKCDEIKRLRAEIEKLEKINKDLEKEAQNWKMTLADVVNESGEKSLSSDAMLNSIEAIIKQEGKKSLKRILEVLETRRHSLSELSFTDNREGFRN